VAADPIKGEKALYTNVRCSVLPYGRWSGDAGKSDGSGYTYPPLWGQIVTIWSGSF